MSFFRRIIGAVTGNPEPRTTILSETTIRSREELDRRDGRDGRDPESGDAGSGDRRRGRRGGRGRGRGEGSSASMATQPAPQASTGVSREAEPRPAGRSDDRDRGGNGSSPDRGSSDRGSYDRRSRFGRPRREDLDAPLPEDIAFRPASEGGDASIVPGRRRRPPGARTPGRIFSSDLSQYVARDGAGSTEPPLLLDRYDQPDTDGTAAVDGDGDGTEIRRRRRGRRGGRGRRRPGDGEQGESGPADQASPDGVAYPAGLDRAPSDEDDDYEPADNEQDGYAPDDENEHDEAFTEEEGDEYDEGVGLAPEAIERESRPSPDEDEDSRFSRQPAIAREVVREVRREASQQAPQPRRDAHAPLPPVDPALLPEAFRALGVALPTLETIARFGFTEPSPIQEQTIPLLLAGRDIVGVAQTGTGKTLAFGIPMMERLDPSRRAVQALVLVPTRELASQVLQVVEDLAYAYGLEAVGLLGGHALDRDFRALERRPHIVVGTPGRIIDHLHRGTLSLSDVHYAVLDEADQMLDIGFLPDITRILSRTPRARQTALFSATMPHTIMRLVRRYMTEPEMIAIAPELSTVESVEQVYYEVAQRDKLWGLRELVKRELSGRTLVFSRTRRGVDYVAAQLSDQGVRVGALHGDMDQGRRDRVVQSFRAGELDILIATNVAARGIDIPEITHVVNFDVPQNPEEYVHRIGRTGRAGREGKAITFVCERDLAEFDVLLHAFGDRLHKEELELYG